MAIFHIKIYFCHLKLEIALAIPASNDEKYNRNNWTIQRWSIVCDAGPTADPSGPDSSFVSTGACNHQVRMAVGPGICHRGCAYTVLKGVFGAAYGTVHCKEPLKSFEIRVGHSPGFGFPSFLMDPVGEICI